MRTLIILLIACLMLTSCSIFRVKKLDVEQGNVITDEQTSKLHTGMTKAQVIEVMGNPVLKNTFDDNRMEYAYTFKPGYGPLVEKHLTVLLRNNRVIKIISLPSF